MCVIQYILSRLVRLCQMLKTKENLKIIQSSGAFNLVTCHCSFWKVEFCMDIPVWVTLRWLFISTDGCLTVKLLTAVITCILMPFCFSWVRRCAAATAAHCFWIETVMLRNGWWFPCWLSFACIHRQNKVVTRFHFTQHKNTSHVADPSGSLFRHCELPLISCYWQTSSDLLNRH